ncbi:AtpZ/AtpI family protein [Nocardioides pantholopis]|uniref:AtpZ/AtpI family protein n=1 Tax=Nocardioides pantholopis TaxID=2483798 RepID=UPI000F089FAD|nr:AtpZ/AtpI family protein [Nocardioides pantholopis]
MAQNDERDRTQPQPDPWQAVSMMLAGVLFYGVLGWLADRWLGTDFLVAIGILVGAGLGVYSVVKRFGAPEEPGPKK